MSQPAPRRCPWTRDEMVANWRGQFAAGDLTLRELLREANRPKFVGRLRTMQAVIRDVVVPVWREQQGGR